ncbi:MAG: ParB N-terminal domain-containing protein [Nitrososphaerota archaeon]|nr:ParB N-terminal domain-containing protein [Nitrososphaerota archaeon]
MEKPAEVNVLRKMEQEEIHIDPRYEAVVPPQSNEELTALRASIEKDGQRDPIIVNREGVVLDGHTRFKILKGMGRPVKFEVRSFPSKEREMDFVIEAAVLRRNLSPFQKIKLAQPALKRERERAEERQRRGTFLSNEGEVGEAMEIVAKQFGISKTTFERGQYIIKHATSEQIASIDRGDATINGIYDILKGKIVERKARAGAANDSHSNNKSQRTGIEPDTTQELKHAGQSSNKEGEGLDSKSECQKCHEKVTRADLKLVLLCTVCRRKNRINF